MRPSLEQPLLYERVNVQGTLVLLELARLSESRGLSLHLKFDLWRDQQGPFRRNVKPTLIPSPLME